MNWGAFRATAPELARLAEERFARSGVALLGTIRREGTPRISPVEPVIVGDFLLLGMMWHSTKALDLLRDSRCVLHNAISSVEGTEGECKLYGGAEEAQDPALREQHRRTFLDHWGENAPAAFHVFSMDIGSAAFIAYDTVNGDMLVKRWDPQHGIEEIRRPYP